MTIAMLAPELKLPLLSILESSMCPLERHFSLFIPGQQIKRVISSGIQPCTEIVD